MDQAQPVGRIDVISDVVCPWCYVGKRQLERGLDLLEKQHLRFTVAWHPFQLNPDMPREGVDRAQYRIAKFGSLERSQQLDERITETAATVGLEFHLDRLTRTPNTLNAHRLIRFAGQRGLQDGVVKGQSPFTLPSAFSYLGSANAGGIPVSLIVAAVVFAGAGLFLRYHRLGRAIYAIGREPGGGPGRRMRSVVPGGTIPPIPPLLLGGPIPPNPPWGGKPPGSEWCR